MTALPNSPMAQPASEAVTSLTHAKGRPAALRPTSQGTRPKQARIGTVAENWEIAAHNSAAYEYDPIRKEIEELAHRSMSAAEAGVRLYAMYRRHPSLLADQGGATSSHIGGDGSRVTRRELLPLPTPKVALIRPAEIDAMFPSNKVLGPQVKQQGAEAWQGLIVAALNGLDSHGNCVSFFGPPTVEQAKALTGLMEDCARFVADDKARTPTDFHKELGAKLQSYWGEPVYCAEDLTLMQVLPTLPAKGIAASVEIVEVLEGQLRDQVGDPDSLLLPEEEWPEKPPRAKTMLKDPKEYGSLANELWQRDLTVWLPESEIFHHGGIPVVSGFFGVGKGKDVPGHPGIEQLRLICNLVPSNGYFREIRGDVDHLPYMMQWGSIILEDDEVLLVSQEDMTCAFYLFKLPRAWCKYFAVGMPIRLDELKGNARARDASTRLAKGADCSGPGYLVLQVLPMGWKSAVGIMQAVHRRILASPLAKGSRLPSAAEIRKTFPMPSSSEQRTLEAWQVYLDNFASFLIVLLKDAEKYEGQASDWHKKARAAWEAWNIPSAADKSVANAYEAKELGCFVDGRAGTLGTTVQRRLDAIALSLFLIAVRNPHRMWLAVGGGRWNFILQFRRALSNIFFGVWRAISQWEDCRFLPRIVGRELLTAAFLAPAMITKLRTRPDLLITCSDASSSGAGIAATAGLTDYGTWAARSLPAELPTSRQSGMALISLFGGIEAGRRALDLLGIPVIRHIAVENNVDAIRSVAEVYPDIIHHRDVKEFSRQTLHNSLAGVHITFVLLLAGFPCQGLSGANATKKGFEDPRSLLFFQAVRIVKDIQAEKHRLQFLFENVASMDAADRDLVSHYLGVRPIMACSSGISQVRRPRYLWATWPMSESPGVEVHQQPAKWCVSFKATLPPPELWLLPGWELVGPDDVKFPTFMRALPKRKETFLPSGIDSTPPDARKRWAKDQWRYPPYQYKKEFCVRRKRQPSELRLLCAQERESLMFVGRDATRYALNPTKAKADPQALEDVRCSLIGNTFHSGVFALVIGVLGERRRLLEQRPTPQQIVDRQGLHPGEVYVAGLQCGLDRAPTFHRLDGQRRGHCFPTFDAARAARSPQSSADLERLTLNALLRSSDYRGSDIRLDSGELMRPCQWPRRSIDPAKWVWYPLLAAPYHDEEHINLLEVRAAHLTLRWRSRSAGRIGSRFFHLLDSQVALAVLCKGRSSSWRMNRILRRVGALTVAAGFMPSWGYFMSQWNPSDKGSRKFERRRAPRKATPRRSRPKKKHWGVSRAAVTKRNRTYTRDFDSTLGYPGEGPRRAASRRQGRSRIRVKVQITRKRVEGVLGRRTSAERRAARLGVSLREGVLAPKSRQLYAEAFRRLWAWAERPPPDEVSSNTAYDRFLAGYIEHAWAEGATRGEAGNALSASVHVYPNLRGRGRLAESWFLLNAWSRYEVPMRAPPMPVEVAIALAWYFVRAGHLGGAFLILLSFDCFLRTGEMLSLFLSDITVADNNTGVVRLAHTKTGQRHAAFEASAFNDPVCGQLFKVLLRSLPVSTHMDNYIFRPKIHVFYTLFKKGLKWLGLEGFGFQPYSLRRGGATAYFRATRSMEAALDRGRWSSARVARIYLNDGLAREVELRFSPEIRRRLARMSAALAIWLRSP